MIGVPAWLALGYVAALVLVVAVTLITVIWLLWGIARGVREIAASLEKVQRQTKPLTDAFGPLDDSLAQVAESLARVRGHLAADARLEPASGEAAAGETSGVAEGKRA